MVKKCKGKNLKGFSCNMRVKKEDTYCRHHRRVQTSDHDDDLCPICIEGDNNMFTLSCSHRLHLECAKGLVKLECPICRSDVTNWPEKLKRTIEINQEERREEIEEEEENEMQEYPRVSFIIDLEEFYSEFNFDNEFLKYIIDMIDPSFVTCEVDVEYE